MAEYDQGAWSRILEKSAWLKCAAPLDYVVTKDTTVRVAKLGGRLVRVTTSDYYRWRREMLRYILESYAGDADSLVELGCGWGLNLFSVVDSNRWQRFSGYDVSANGLEAARRAADHFGIKNLRFAALDLTDSSAPALSELRGKTCFTYHCLEQLKHQTETVIENLVSAGVKRVIHIEPSTELLRPWSLADAINKAYIKVADYQDNLLTTLRWFEGEGRLRIVTPVRTGFSPKLEHDAHLIVWDTVG